MVSSAIVKRSMDARAFVLLSLALAFVMAGVLSAHAGAGVVSHVLEPIQTASSDPLAIPQSAASLGGDDFP
jgi:hypothetical protein